MPLWQDYDAADLRATQAAARALMHKHHGTFYAIAFHEFYGETDTTIGLPCLAANTVEDLNANDYSKWSSPDWKWIDIKFASADLKKLHRALEKYACSEDDGEFWEAAYNRMIKSYIRAITDVAAKLKKHKRAASDFAGFVFTEDDEIENIKKCVTPAQFKKLFPDVVAELEEDRRLGARPVSKKLEKYREDLFSYEDDIVKLGAAAIPMLLEMLEQTDGMATTLLGRIGIAEPQVVAALRKQAKNQKAPNYAPNALALLGDVDYVLKLARSESTRDTAIDGIASLYSGDANDCARKIALDFRPLEKLLDIPACGKVAKALDGMACVEITPADVPEALRGLASTHPTVREQALRILGERSRLDAKSGAQIAPAVAASLSDRKASIRKLALFALAEWKRAAKPYLSEIRRCTKDSNADVVYAAKHCLSEIK